MKQQSRMTCPCEYCCAFRSIEGYLAFAVKPCLYQRSEDHPPVVNLKRDRIIAIEQQLEVLEKEAATLKKALQKECNHSQVVEVEYSHSVYFNSSPPRRLCLLCGLEEDGWGCGYQKLRTEPIHIFSDRERHRFYQLRKLKPLQTREVILLPE